MPEAARWSGRDPFGEAHTGRISTDRDPWEFITERLAAGWTRLSVTRHGITYESQEGKRDA